MDRGPLDTPELFNVSDFHPNNCQFVTYGYVQMNEDTGLLDIKTPWDENQEGA